MATYSSTPVKVDQGLPGVDPTVNDGGVQYVTPAPVAYGSPSVNTMSGPPAERQFAISCFEIGDCGTCLLSYIFSPCAIAYGRSYLDGSDMCVTCYNMNPIILRWITRSAYNIPGSAWEDCFLGMFCPCCVINQVAQTTQRYGRPNAFVGPENNNSLFSVQNSNDCCANCCYATFCLPCAIGTSLEHSMGMPFCMGCMFANFCISRNLMRYHYRIKGSDCMEDCFFPYGICFLATICSSYIPCVYCMTCPYFVAMIMGILHESKVRGNPAPNSPNGSYLHPPTTVPFGGFQNGGVQLGLPGAQSALINSNGIQMVQQQQPQFVYNGGVITQVAPVATYAQPTNPYTQPHPVYVQIQQQQMLQQQQMQQQQVYQQQPYVPSPAQQPYAPLSATAPTAVMEANEPYPTVTAKAL